MTDLTFPGYQSLEAGQADPFRIKWNAVRLALDLPASFAPLELGFDKISARNAAINSQIVYTPEPGGTDVWQTPMQTLALKRGDCEDFAILKYAALTKAGIPARLVIGEIRKLGMGNLNGNEPHAWVAAQINGLWWALDNKFPQLERAETYINWTPLAAMHDASVARFGKQFTLNEMLNRPKA